MASTSTTTPDSQIEIRNAFDELAPLSEFISASTSATSFDVFINHRGPDVKHTLARAMYNALHATGLRVFLDSEELQLGDFLPRALEAAMCSAPLHVAIFSPTYAESPWCLAELSFMLRCGATIIPVFYHVQPTDLRWVAQGKGMYAKAFLEHQQKGRYSLQKLKEWKMALQHVSFNMGEIIDNNDEEQMKLKTIVNHVLKVMHIVPLVVAKYPVGLEKAVADFEKIVKSQANVQIVGISGMGGSGKTTLAKELYNQNHSFAQFSSFVFDVRDAAKNNKLHKRQRKLLEDLGFKGEKVENVEEGKGILSNRLKTDRVLIVLDDVDHTDQLDALLPTKDSLGLGSLIIVTTREKGVLQSWGVSSIYEMKSMDLFHAKQLFCWHAFLQPDPLLGFEELVEEFVSACNGLPLSLKVFGGQLYGCSDNDLWKDLLDKIFKILPMDIKDCLRVSYDALDCHEKQIFLDIACFFIGKDYRRAITVWEGSGWNGLYGWKRLVNKCLVELDDDNHIKMHDHLRDLGREIANTQPPYRLCSPLPDQIMDIHKREGERFQIRGMILNIKTDGGYEFPGFLVNTSTGYRGPTLRLAKKVFFVGENYLNMGFCDLSGDLLWLSCTDFDHGYLPSWLQIRNLRVLELDNSNKLEELWKDGASMQAPVQLRELVIYNCERFQRFPKSIGLLLYLKKIVVYRSMDLRSLPEEFCLLQSLEHLQLDGCPVLSSLPSSFGDLANLQHLELLKCYKLRMLPVSFKNLTHLQHLGIFYCTVLTLESDILKNMAKLEYLSLSQLPELKELPHFTTQAALRNLYLDSTGIRELPVNMGQLSKLRVMEIESCKIQFLPESLGCLNDLEHLVLKNLAVECLPGSFTCPISESLFGRESFSSSLCKLKEISLSWTKVSKILISDNCCPNLQILTLIDNDLLRELHTLPKSLKFIRVYGCRRLINMRGIDGLSNLQTLSLRGCPEVDTLPSFAELTSLQIIEMEGCGNVEKIEGLRLCRSLNTVKIKYCSGLKALPSFAELTSLRKLELQDCSKCSIIESLQHCRMLEAIIIRYCPELHSLPSFADLISLKVIELEGHNRVDKIEGLQHCTSLEKLKITGGLELHSLQVYELERLQIFELEGLSKIEKIEGLQQSTSLEELKISNCPLLRSLPSFANLISLEVFEMKGYNKVKKIEGLQQCMSVKKLKLIRAPVLCSLQIFELKQLEVFELNCLQKVEKIEGLQHCTSLEKLQISGCPLLSSLPSFADLISLEVFELEGPNKIEKIKGLQLCTSLEKLKISHCPGLHSLETFELEYLEVFELKGLNKIEIIKGLQYCISLEKLKINGCPLLHSLPSLSDLIFLKVFELEGCNKVEKVEGLQHCTLLEKLKISDGLEFRSLPVLELEHLQVMELEGLRQIEKIQGLQHSTSLETLKISGCPLLNSLPCFGNLISLKVFELKGCNKVEKIEGLQHCKSLGQLKITGGLELHSLQVFELRRLQILELEGLYKIQKIEGLQHCISLEKVKLNGCPLLHSLPSFANLIFLKVFELEGLYKIENIEGLQHCKSLEKLKISDCRVLHSLPSFVGLISLKVFEFEGHNKVHKIEGLQHCTSLERLMVEHTNIGNSLKNMQRLRMLQLVANNKSAIKPLIKTIKKMPEKLIICTKAAPGVGVILNSLAFPKLSVIHSFSNQRRIEITAPMNSFSINSAFMLCLVINCWSPRTKLTIGNIRGLWTISSIGVDNGIAIAIGLFFDRSSFIGIRDGFSLLLTVDGLAEVEKGFLLSGEENDIVKAFHRLFARLRNS